jgi:hypothetical protein
MNKIYAAFILFISVFLLEKFLPENTNSISHKNAEIVNTQLSSENKEVAILAGGCFWCMEHPFEDLPGVFQACLGIPEAKRKTLLIKKWHEERPGMLKRWRFILIPKKFLMRTF